jgi:hypothetical protein
MCPRQISLFTEQSTSLAKYYGMPTKEKQRFYRRMNFLKIKQKMEYVQQNKFEI